MINSLSRIISIILHPILMPLYAVSVLLFSTYIGFFLTPKGKLFVILVVGVFSLLLPLLFITVMRTLGWISSFHLASRKERIPILLFTILSCYLCSLIFRNISSLPALFAELMVALAFLLLLLAMITRFWKISLHMAAIGGLAWLIFYFTLQETLLFPLVVFLAGLLGTARLQLRKHTPTQVYLGFLVGVSFFFCYFNLI